MDWKRQPSWLKGGVIGAIISVIGIIFIIIADNIVCPNLYECFISPSVFYASINGIIYQPLMNLFVPASWSYPYDIHREIYIVGFITSLINYAVIGIIIGWIIGKIKKK